MERLSDQNPAMLKVSPPSQPALFGAGQLSATTGFLGAQDPLHQPELQPQLRLTPL